MRLRRQKAAISSLGMSILALNGRLLRSRMILLGGSNSRVPCRSLDPAAAGGAGIRNITVAVREPQVP